MIKRLQHLSYEERLRELKLFRLQKSRNIVIFKYRKGERKGDGARLSSVMLSYRIRGNGQKMEHKEFPLNISSELSPVWMMAHCHRLPREVVDTSSLGTFRARFDGALSNLI